MEIYDSAKTLYIDLETMAKIIKDVGVANIMDKLIPYLEEDFSNWDEFAKIPRPTHHSPVGVNELMPVGNSETFTCKYVNGHPDNPKDNKLTVVAIGILCDVADGYPKMLCEMTLLTAIRTAANSAMAAKYLAKENPQSMALIGNGCQSEFQVIAFHSLLGVEEFNLYDIDEKATDKLIENLSHIEGITLNKCASTKEACLGVDIITTVTADKKFSTILTKDMIEKGVHINCVGGDCPGKTELESDILYMGDVYVEFEPQSRIEGEIQHMDDDFKVTEIAEVIKTGKRIDRAEDDITIFDSVGFALEDFSILRLIYDMAREEKIGEEELLVPAMDDCKNLYGLLK